MSKKRVKSGAASAGPAKWESAILQATLSDDAWRANVYFMIENRVEDKANLDALATGVKAGTRRLFSIFSKEELYAEVRDLGNPKNKKAKETPANYEICEPCKTYLDTDDDIPVNLLVKLLKWKFLSIKTNDLRRRDAEKKAAADREKGGGKKDKGKESKSAKGKGKKTPEPPSPKKESTLRKRGDEDLDSKYIDDEPDDGPNHYILVYGFQQPYLFQMLDEIGVPIEATIKFRSQVYAEDEKKDDQQEEDTQQAPVDEEAEKALRMSRRKLKKFWHDFNIIIDKVGNTSNVHDLARLEYNVQSIIIPDDPNDQEKKTEFSATLYEDVACLCYDLIDTKRQYKNYLENMKLLSIPSAAPQSAQQTAVDETPSEELDMRYYNDLMNTVPQESACVELIMYCMLEQIDAKEEGRPPPSEVGKPLGEDGVDDKVSAEIDALVASLALDESELEALGPEISVEAKESEPSSKPKLLSPHDDISMRTEHLKPMRGLNPKKADLEMLRYIPFAGMNAFARPSSRVAKERSARLQELIHFFTSTGLAQSEIDRALKQFVFECIDLTGIDQNGLIVTKEGEGAHHSLIPWDDPYPYFKDVLPKSDVDDSAASSRDVTGSAGSREGAKSPSPSVVKTPPDSRSSTPGILRNPSRCTQHTHSAVHFGTDHEGIEILPLKDSPNPEKSIEDSMEEIIDAQKRNLDQWCFAEHHDPHVLLQVLRKAMYNLPYYDTYYNKRDHCLMVVLHNPHNQDMLNCNYWENNLHSGVGFRNYIEHVAESIDGFTRAEEAKYQAKLLRSEVDQIEEEIKSASRSASADKKRGRSKSPKKSGRGRSTSRSDSQERSTSRIGEDYVRADSLKAAKVELDRLKAEEEEKERQKAEKRARSATKKSAKEAASAEKEKKRPGSKGSKSGSRKSSPAATPKEDAAVTEEPKEPERFWPFIGYDIGHELIHASGKYSNLFPTDGGLIRTERIDFILGKTIVKTTVVKDGHVFSLHVLDPKLDNSDDENIDSDENEEPKDQPVEDLEGEGKEKAELEENEKEKEVILELGDEKPKPSVSKYGSFSAQFRDGLILTYSSFGESGTPDCKSDEVEPPPAPAPATNRTPTPATKEGKESPRKREKSAEKTVTPEPQEEEKVIIKDPYRRPFQKLYLTSPDGLQVTLQSERDCGGPKGSDIIVVKQSYPQKTANLQKCESARLVPAMAEASRIITKEGSVIKTMADGRNEVLFADGTVSSMTGSPLPLPVQPQSTRTGSASTKTREGNESPSKRSSQKLRKASEPEKEVQEEKKPEGLWQTTLPSGKRISTNMDGITPVSCKDALVCKAHDPETHEQMFSREDKVIVVYRPDGTTLVEHADGTRITRFMAETEVPAPITEEGKEPENMVILERIVRVECPGFASVEFNEQSGHCNVSIGSTVVHAYPDASYILDLSSDERLNIDADGSASYFPRPNNDIVYQEANQELTYFMRHDHEIVFECLDNEGNLFTVKSSGDVAVQSHSKDDESISTSEDDMDEIKSGENKIHLYKQHSPRFFLVHADGSGTELLRYQDIAEYLTDSESDPNTAVLIDSLADFPNVTGINILRPADLGLSQRWLKGYESPSIIPKGLRSRDLTSLPPVEVKTEGVPFGTDAGQGLAIGSAAPPPPPLVGPKCPHVLEHRQLVQFRPVTDEIREKMYECLREYATFVKERSEQIDGMKVIEPRSEEELMHAADLVLQSMPSKANDLTSSSSITDVYERATAPPEMSPPPTPQPKRTAADWERDRREAEQEEENREAMRNMDVPPYFQSEMGKSFLLSQGPDMEALMRELVQDPRQSSEAAVRSNANTPPSPCNDTGPHPTGNTPSKLRPGNPTPSHATGDGSPAPVRPTAPTPAHANTAVERPVNPTPKEAVHEKDTPESKISDIPCIPEMIVEEETRTPRSSRNKPLRQDVLGEPRKKPVYVPAYLKASRRVVEDNIKFLYTEEPARRKILTSSVAGATEKGKVLLQNTRGFELLPAELNFGTLREGYTYQFPVHLKNVGVDTCRYKIEQPPPVTGIRVQYHPGPVAAGMKAILNVEIYAVASGVDSDRSGTSEIEHELRIVTETHYLALPIKAKILTAADYDNRPPSKKCLPSAGVQLIHRKAPGTQGIIKPRKQDDCRQSSAAEPMSSQ